MGNLNITAENRSWGERIKKYSFTGETKRATNPMDLSPFIGLGNYGKTATSSTSASAFLGKAFTVTQERAGRLVK